MPGPVAAGRLHRLRPADRAATGRQALRRRGPAGHGAAYRGAAEALVVGGNAAYLLRAGSSFSPEDPMRTLSLALAAALTLAGAAALADETPTPAPAHPCFS